MTSGSINLNANIQIPLCHSGKKNPGKALSNYHTFSAVPGEIILAPYASIVSPRRSYQFSNFTILRDTYLLRQQGMQIHSPRKI